MLPPELILSLMVIMTRLFSRSVSQKACGPGWFGLDCKHQCWCRGKLCAADGECVRNAICDDQLFGPSCQYKNIMSTAKTTNPWVKDGSLITCNAGSPFITADLAESYRVSWMRIVFGTKALTPNTIPELHFSFIGISHNIEACSHRKVFTVDQRTVDIHCDVKTNINQITIRGNDTLRMCELLVSGGRNLALKQRTTQTSNLTYAWFTYVSALAVDGSRNTYFNLRACTHTEFTDRNPSWSVYFPSSVIIYQAVIINRNDRQQRLENFTLKVFDINDTLVDFYKNPGSAKSIYSIIFTMARDVRKISIGLHTPNLTLCEVETYGELICPRLKWGLDCLNDCLCKPSELCSPITGKCDAGCKIGAYGRICERECPKYCSDRECFRDTGFCVTCEKGYMGDSCDKDCLPNTYGSDCLLTCHSNCRKINCSNSASVCSERVCDHDGRCLACRNIKSYGVNCTQACPKNCQINSCDIQNGTCYSCQIGFFGNLCSQACSGNCKDGCDLESGLCNDCQSTFYGDNCALECPFTCQERLCHAQSGNCSNRCPNVFYGATCSYPCPKTCANQNCDDLDGNCMDGCETGLFGHNCSDICPRRCTDRSCDFKNGTCYTCDVGFYGGACDVPCSQLCTRRPCDIESGLCSIEEEVDYHPEIVAPVVAFVVLLLLATVLLWKRNSESDEDEE